MFRAAGHWPVPPTPAILPRAPRTSAARTTSRPTTPAFIAGCVNRGVIGAPSVSSFAFPGPRCTSGPARDYPEMAVAGARRSPSSWPAPPITIARSLSSIPQLRWTVHRRSTSGGPASGRRRVVAYLRPIVRITLGSTAHANDAADRRHANVSILMDGRPARSYHLEPRSGTDNTEPPSSGVILRRDRRAGAD